MRLKDYLAQYAGLGQAAMVRGVAEWLEQEAQVLHNLSNGDDGRNVTAAHYLTTSRALFDQLVECWQ